MPRDVIRRETPDGGCVKVHLRIEVRAARTLHGDRSPDVLERIVPDLPDSFPRQTELLSDRVECLPWEILEAVVQEEHLALPDREPAHHVLDERHQRIRRVRRLSGYEDILVTERLGIVRVGFEAARVARHMRTEFGLDLIRTDELVQRIACCAYCCRIRPDDPCDRILRRQVVDHALPLSHLDASLHGDDVRGEPDVPCGVVGTAVHGLSDPEHGVGREAGPVLRVELLCRSDKADESVLNDIVELLPAAHTCARRADAETEIREDESLDRGACSVIMVLRRPVRTFTHRSAEVDFLLRRE